MSNGAEDAYAGWPERLYVIGSDGRVAYAGGLGPDEYLPSEVGAWLQEYAASAAVDADTAE